MKQKLNIILNNLHDKYCILFFYYCYVSNGFLKCIIAIIIMYLPVLPIILWDIVSKLNVFYFIYLISDIYYLMFNRFLFDIILS